MSALIDTYTPITLFAICSITCLSITAIATRCRAYSIMDSSRISTFLISILLIVYGSFRSLNMEQEAREREKEKERSNLLTGTSNNSAGNPDGANGGRVQTLDTMHALCLPLGASISLLVMFFFFDSMQMLLAICTASTFGNKFDLE